MRLCHPAPPLLALPTLGDSTHVGSSKSGSICPRLPKAARGCPRLPKAAQGCPRLPMAAQGFPRLPKAAQDCRRLPKVVIVKLKAAKASWVTQEGLMEQHALKNVNNCLNTNIYSYLETPADKSYYLYLNVVHFFNTSVNFRSVTGQDCCFPALVYNMCCSIVSDKW